MSITPEDAAVEAKALAERAHALTVERDETIAKMFDILADSGHPNVNYECMSLLQQAREAAKRP